MKKLAAALVSIAIVAGIVWAAVPNGPQPAVQIYWYTSSDPTTGAGVVAPLAQLLIRQDVPSIYFKSGTANTAWTKIGSGAASGGTVTSITCGTGLTCAATNPITTSGTISLTTPGPTGSGTAGTLPIWTSSTALGNSHTVENGSFGHTTEMTNNFFVVDGGSTFQNNVNVGTTADPATLTANDTIGTTIGGGTWNLAVNDVTSEIAGVGGNLQFQGSTTGTGGGNLGAELKLSKTNSSSGDTAFDLIFSTAKTGAAGTGVAMTLNHDQSVNFDGILHTVTDPVVAQDAATKHYVDTSTTPSGSISGTLNTMAKFASTTTVGNSSVTDNTIVVQTAEPVNVGAFTDIGQFSVSGSIAPTSFGGTRVDNYNPAGLATAYVIDQVVTSATTITGLTAQVTGTQIDFRNSSTSTGALTFSNADANSSAGNQFALAGAVNWIVPPGSSLILRYTGSDWRLLAMVTTDLPTLTVDGAATVNGLFTANASATINGATNVQRFVETVATPASLGSAGSINDYTCSPTDCSTATIINLTSTGIISFDGLSITNTPGRIITLHNIGGQAINIINGAAGSAAANRFATVGGTTWALAAGQSASATFYYDAATSLWTQIATETLSGLTVTNAATISGNSTLTGAVTHSNTDTWSGATSHIKSTSTSPSLSAGCGTGATITGGDISGTVVENATSFSAPCTLTFASTFTTAPTCTASPRGIQAAFTYTTNATTLAVTNTSAETFDYICIGH